MKFLCIFFKPLWSCCFQASRAWLVPDLCPTYAPLEAQGTRRWSPNSAKTDTTSLERSTETIHSSATSATCKYFVNKLWVRLNSIICMKRKEQCFHCAATISNLWDMLCLLQLKPSHNHRLCVSTPLPCSQVQTFKDVKGRKMCKICTWSCLGIIGVLRAQTRAKHGFTRNPETTAKKSPAVTKLLSGLTILFLCSSSIIVTTLLVSTATRVQ